MRTLLASLTLLVPLVAEAAPATPPKPMAVCVNQITGVVTARTRCKSSEGPMNLGTIAALATGPKGEQGAQGPKGETGRIDVATCYSNRATSASTFGIAFTTATCRDPEAEFMLSEGITKTRSVPVPTEKEVLFDASGNIPVGVKYTTGYIVPSSSNSAFEATVTIVCCKR